MSRDSAKFNCPRCGRRTYSERGLRFHTRLCHPEKVEDVGGVRNGLYGSQSTY
jgi:hypothetical protein